MGEQVCNLLPAAFRCISLEIEGLGNRLAGDRHLQGEAPRVSGGLRPGRILLRRAGSHIISVGEEGGDNGGNDRGMQKRFHHTGALGIDGSAVELQDLLFPQNVEVGAEVKLPCDVAAGNRVDL
jgi:hypothetical protein